MKNFNLFIRNILPLGQIRQLAVAATVYVLALLLPGRLFAQAPAIGYSTPQTYNAGTAITPLSPANTGGVVAAFGFNAPKAITTGVGDPVSMTMDKSGNMYIGTGSGKVWLLPAGSSAATVFASGFGVVWSVKLDASNNVYAADGSHVWLIPAGGGTPVSIGSFVAPYGLAFDAAGNLYVADNSNGSHPGVYKIVPGVSGQTTIDNNLPAPAFIAFDSNDNLYIGDQINQALYEIPAGGTQQRVVASGVSPVKSLAIDPSGNVYLSGNSSISCYSPGTGLVTVQPIFANGLMTDAGFNLYYADGGNINKMSPSGGYFASNELPEGLIINSSTGVISGTPVSVSPAAGYTIKAFNASGSSSATVNITVNAMLPVISYSSPQSYRVGTAIGALSPSSSNVAAWAYGGSATSIGSGLVGPVDVASDAAGNVYVADAATNNIVKIPAGNGTPVTLAALSAPLGIAVDATGNVYVATASAGAILEVPAGGGPVNPVGSGFAGPSAVAVDGSGNVYVADAGNGALKEVPAGNPVGTGPITIKSGFNNIQGVAVDGAGNVYVADAGVGLSGNGAVYKIPAGGGPMISVGTGFSRPGGVAVDAAGNVYVADINKSVITVIEPDGAQFTIGSGFNAPNGVTADGLGNVYIADSGNGKVKEVKINGGYFLSPFLPAGLTFNNNTGIISGTPTAAAAAANYTVTAYNVTGSARSIINISVTPVISYNSPVAYATGVAITPLMPLVSGGTIAAPGFNTTETALATGLNDATCLAVGPDGSIYIGESSGKVSKLVAGANSTTVLATGFSTSGFTEGIAVDASGNVYFADGLSVWKIPAGGGSATVLGSFVGPTGVAVDASGNIYIAANSAPPNGGVYKIAPDGTGKTTIINIAQANVTVDHNGNVFSANNASGDVNEVPVGGVVKTLHFFSQNVRAISTDLSGNFYALTRDSRITMRPANGSAAIQVLTGSGTTAGLAIDANFNVYTVDSGNIVKVNATGGYFTNPELPNGLTIDPATGAIGGTPAASSAAANFAVTAFNAYGSASATVNITVGPAPAISYSTPQTYTRGVAVTPLLPSSTGAPISGPAFSTSITLSTGITDATCMAMDKSGNMYIGESSGKVSKLAAGAGIATVYATGFAGVDAYTSEGIAVDASGNVYFVDLHSVWKIPAGGGAPFTLGSFGEPGGVAVDAAGNVYVADQRGPGGVFKMAGDGSGQTKISNFGFASGIAVDANGNVFIVDGLFDELYEIPAGGTFKRLSGLIEPTCVAVDAAGNVYIGNPNGRGLQFLSAGGGSPSFIGPNFGGSVTGLMVDPNFNLYVANDGIISKISAAGGYFVSPELPNGLTINPNNGAISGTPTAVSPATNYTVTAFSGSVSATATVNITVNPPTPIISYATPQTYTVGIAITPLTPSSTGGAVGAFGFNTTSTTVNTEVNDAVSLAMDKSGNLYIGEGSGNISVLPAGASTATVFATGFSGAWSVALDASDNVFLADGTHIWKIPAGGGTAVSLGSFHSPVGLAFDAAGNIYVADNAGATGGVFKMNSDGTGQTRIDNNLPQPAYIAFDNNGNLFIGDQTAGALYEIPAGGVQKQVASGLGIIVSVVTDPSGNVYTSGRFGGIYCYSPGSGVTHINSTFTNGLMTDANFNLYYAYGNIYKISPSGGYFTNPQLPAGLAIDPGSGAISGTPTAVSPATDYTVTAFSGSVSGTAPVNIAVNPSAPVISYTTPQVFVQNTAILPLNPVSVYVAAPAYLSTATTAGSFAQPFATAVDQSGNVYVADKSANSLYELPAGGGQVTIGTGLNTPAGVAVDKSGNVYTVSQGDNTVVEIQAHTGTQTNVGSGYQRPTAVAVDSAGNVFVADVQGPAGVIYKISPGQSKQLFKSGFISPNGIAVDAAGNVYVSDFGGGATTSKVYEISPDGSTETPVNHSFSTATGVAVDATGNLFIVDAGNLNIIEYPAGGGSAITLTAGLTFPFGLSADGAGNLYVADPGATKVVKLAPGGGYFINQALPAGLSLNAATGAISGTPTAASTATNYTVTAYDIIGRSGTATVNIKVTSTDATLASLSLSSGTVSPGFSPGGISYAAGVPYSASSITVTATPTDAGATIVTKVNGNPASGPAPLNVGVNTINVKVTAADGVTTKTYTVTVTRVASQNAYLSSISPSVGHLSPAFAQAVTSYTLSVSNATAAMTVTPVSTDPGASIKVNGSTVTSGTQSNPITLAPGAQTTINIAVTAPNGHIITYAITVTRAPDFIATLSNIQVSAGTPKPVFAPAILNYNVRVTNLNTSIAITPTATDPNATITVNGTTTASGTPATINNLVVGNNTVTIVVTAQDGTTTKTYTVTVNRPPSIDCFLSSMNPSRQPLSPMFAPATTSYTLEVPNAIATMTLAPVTAEPNATMTINNAPATSGARSGPIALALGPNTITMVVTAQDGTSKKTYTITVTRDAPPVADVANTVYQPVSVDKPTTTPTLADDGIVVHQGISPNGDGQNDFLQIDNIGQYPENKLSIMNRNGQLVYEAKGYDNTTKTFDGHNNKNGQMQLPGTYFYQLDYTANGITKHKTGFLVLKY